jgi:hypothetical protein
MLQEQFSTSDTTEERWAEISGFPGYSVSDYGRVLNQMTGFYLTPTKKPSGLVMVGLMSRTKQHTLQCKRSLPLLVASAFVQRPSNESFDTPINLDGDRMNNNYTNLMWRPLWFARKYAKQFHDGHVIFDRPIEDVETGEIYRDSMHASTYNGILDVEIYLSMLNNTYVWPTGQIFREAR